MVLGVDLKDAREEVFVRMVCDGLTLGVAYARAGFKGGPAAAHQLFQLPRLQERAAAILEARRTTGVVTLPEVTDMLQRVFAGAHAAEEYSAAHNAAFSLARLYGHVTDRQTLEVIRRPSRDPDAPSEQVLSDWVASLPVVNPALEGPSSEPLEGPSSEPLEGPSSEPLEGPSSEPLEGPPRGAPAGLLGPGPYSVAQLASGRSPGLDVNASVAPGPQGPSPQLDLFNDINGLDEGPAKGRAETGNGAPARPVTGTPNRRAHSNSLGVPPKPKGAPRKSKKGTCIPSEARSEGPKGPEYPNAKDLFG